MMLSIMPMLPVSADNARAVAQEFSDIIVKARAQNHVTAELASQMKADISQQIKHWPETDKAQFQLWLSQCLREINALSVQGIEKLPERKPIMYYFMIFTCIKVVSFIFVAAYGWVVGPLIFNGY
jgi:hypothetical protein